MTVTLDDVTKKKPAEQPAATELVLTDDGIGFGLSSSARPELRSPARSGA